MLRVVMLCLAHKIPDRLVYVRDDRADRAAGSTHPPAAWYRHSPKRKGEQMRRGKIIAMRDTQATVLEESTKRTWKIPCLAMQGSHGAERREEQAPYEPPPEPASATTHTREFQRGDTVTLNDRDGRNITGVIVRINQRTAILGTGDGGTWRAPFHALRRVLDV